MLTTSIGGEEPKISYNSFVQMDNDCDNSYLAEQKRSSTADPQDRSFKLSDGQGRNQKYHLKVTKIREFKNTLFNKAFFVNSNVYGKLIFTFD